MLRVGAAVPDPPFELPEAPGVEGFDPAMMQALGGELDRRVSVVRYSGADFNGIFAGLDDGRYDVVASGTTVTAERQKLARFCRPYLRSGQSLVVAVGSDIGSINDLTGRRLGVQRGNTSEPVAMKLQQEGRLREVRRYDYDSIAAALDGVETGAIDGFMKLEPVMRWLVRNRPRLRIVQTRITEETLAVAVSRNNDELAADIDRALDTLRRNGTLSALGRAWMQTDDAPSGTEVIT